MTQRVVGDFNGDGYADTAIGNPEYSDGLGAITVLYGSASGLTASSSQYFTPRSAGMPGQVAATTHSNFGFNLTVGHFSSRNSYSDLAIAMPFFDSGCCAGALVILHGAAAGLTTQSSQFLPSPAGLTSLAGSGWVMAAGDFNHDGVEDLAVGAPFNGGDGYHETADDRIGAVWIAYGSATGLTPAQTVFDENTPGMPTLGVAQAYADQMGWALAAGDVNGDGFADLAIDVRGKNEVIVLFGSAAGLTTRAGQILPSLGPYGGYSLAVGDFNHDGYADLAVGDPYAAPQPNGVEGVVEIHYGSPSGLGSVAYRTAQQLALTTAGMPKSADKGFGYALATGDINRDGYVDLAVSDLGTFEINGGPSGLTVQGSKFLHGGSTMGLGRSVGVADFNHDGFSDIAIGFVGVKVEVHPGASLGAKYAKAGAAPSFTETTPGLAMPPPAPSDLGDFFADSLSAPGTHNGG